MDHSVRRRFEQLKVAGALPSPRGVALAVMEMALRPDASAERMARLIQTDPAMAGRVIRFANAVAAGSSRHVASVSRAITILGMFRLRQIVLGFSLVDEYRSGRCRTFDYGRYWSISLATALAAQRLAEVAQSPPGESFTCGLLAGVGRLALATVFPEDYACILEKTHEPEALLRAEDECFGIDHAQLSAEMLAGWGLPEIFVEAVRHHEGQSRPWEPGSRAYALACALHLALRIGQLLMLDDAGRWEQVPSLYNAAGRVGLGQDEVGPLMEEIAAQWHAWTEELGLPNRNHGNLDALLDGPPAAIAEGTGQSALRVGLVGGDPGHREILIRALGILGLPYAMAVSLDALASQEGIPNLVFLDFDPSRDGQAPLDRSRELALAGTAVVLLIPPSVEQDFPGFLERGGAMDYLTYGFTEAAAIARLKNAQRLMSLQSAIRAEREQAIHASSQWAQANRRLMYEALTDPLTQLPNRRYGLDRFAQEWSIATSNGLPIACMMMDIDHFKRVNDTYGHETGDVVLRQFADIIQRCCRRSDVVFRYGGEEFCCICPGTGLDEARQLAFRVMEAVREARFGNGDKPLRATLSIGLAMRLPPMSQPAELIAEADRALYRAKEGGRNRVVSA